MTSAACRNGAIDSKSGTGIIPGSSFEPAMRTPVLFARSIRPRTSCSLSVPLMMYRVMADVGYAALFFATVRKSFYEALIRREAGCLQSIRVQRLRVNLSVLADVQHVKMKSEGTDLPQQGIDEAACQSRAVVGPQTIPNQQQIVAEVFAGVRSN